jgi:putative endonuclease
MVARISSGTSCTGTMESAITREKQLKAGSRRRKLQLIEVLNPAWEDLYESIVW